MYSSNYKRYQRKKKINTVKSISIIVVLFLIGFGIAFFLNSDSIIIDETGIQILWSKPKVENEVPDLVLPEDETELDEKEEILEEVVIDIVEKSIYFDQERSVDQAYLEEIIAKYESGEITSVVMPLKLQTGYINYKSILSYVNLQTGYDLTKAIETLKENNVYVIAEMYTYTDDLFIIQYRESAIMTHNDYVFLDITKKRTINPYDGYGNEYINDLLKEVENLGVDEIMLAGYHFTEAGQISYVKYEGDEESRKQVLVSNLKEMVSNLEIPVSVRLSKSALLEVNSTYENVEEFAKVAKTLYVPVTNAEEKLLFDNLNIENKGIISQEYKEENYNNIEY